MMAMKTLALYLVLLLAGLSLAVVLIDAGGSRLRLRRKRTRGGAVGVVIDRDGNVLGTYVDPFADPWRNPRMHGPGSPWCPPARWGQESPRAWEGFGETAEQAREAANRLRRRHLQFFGLLEADADEDETDPGLLYPPPGV